MDLTDLPPLNNIVALTNLPSILAHGICSLAEMQRRGLAFDSIAEESVQERRAATMVHGLPLHEFACLYFDARNPMLFRRLPWVDDIGVLNVSTAVLTQPGVRVSMQNMAREGTRDIPMPEGLNLLEWDLIYAEEWHHDNARQAHKQKGAKCAEVLVPGIVPPSALLELKVGSPAALATATALNMPLPVTLDYWFFFDQGRRRP